MLTPENRRLRSLRMWFAETMQALGGMLWRFVRGNVVMVVALVAALASL